MKTLIYLLLITGLLSSCNRSTETSDETTSSANAGLIGAWYWNKMSFSNQDTSYVWTDLDGQLIFTENQYSNIYIYRSVPRDTVPRTGNWDNLSKDELRGILSPVTANSGSYKIEGDSILFFREVALWPNAMASDRQPAKLVLPDKTSKDSLVWHIGDYEYIWIRKK